MLWFNEREPYFHPILKRGSLVILVVIVLFSGCYYPGSYAPERKPFEKKFNRIAESTEGYEVIDFIENADILDFLNLEATDPKIT